MGLMTMMRGFSIRLRMLGAIGVVLALLVMVGGAGLWGMQRLKGLNNDFADHVFAETVALSKLHVSLGELRRHERDMIIQYERPENVRASKAEWDKARTAVQAGIAAMSGGEADEDNAVLQEIAELLPKYYEQAERVATSLAEGAYDSATVANRVLRPGHAAFAEVD